MENEENRINQDESSQLVKTLDSPSKKKIASIDTAANITCSLALGVGLDLYNGLSLLGSFVSRAYSIPVNSATGGAYTFWCEKWYKWTNTKKDSNQIRKWAVDLIPFNTMQVPIYMGALALGSLISEGQVNWEKVQNGAINLAIASPAIAPIMRVWANGARKLFGVKSIADGAYHG